MPFFLSERDTKSTERMDDPDCSLEKLINTYRQFSIVNSLISGWRKIYTEHIRPEFIGRNYIGSLLDIGFGGGDIPLKLAAWAAKDQINLNITAIDTDPRAVTFVKKYESSDHVQFKLCSSTELVNRGEQFDIVISNHLLHHLKEDEFKKLLNEAKMLSKKMVLFNDLERSSWAYLLFNFFSRPFFRNSFITQDGLTSLKRSYTLKELKQKVPDHWKVERKFPSRLLLSYKHPDESI